MEADLGKKRRLENLGATEQPSSRVLDVDAPLPVSGGSRTPRNDASHRFATKAELADVREELRRMQALLEKAGLVGVESKPKAASPPSEPADVLSTEAKEVSVTFSESIWDSAIFIGMAPIGAAGSVLLALGLLLNVIIQAVFILIIRQNLAQKVFDEDELNGLSAFRHKIAHDSRFVSEANPISLADRVCNEDLTLEMATTQVTKLTEIKAYLGDDSWLNGPVMCQLALIVWIMCILKEVTSAWNIFSALRRLPSQRRGSVIDPSGADGITLVHMSPGRKAWALALCLGRLTVAAILLWIGIEYLCYTTSIGDLLLNAIALEVVINIDEMVFAAMAPVSACEMVAQLAPLPMTPWPRWRGADVRALLTPVILIGLLVLSGFTSLQDTIDNLKDARDRLCGERRNFMYEFDGLGMVQISPLSSFDIDQAYNISGVASQAVGEVKRSAPTSEWRHALISLSAANSKFMDQADERAMTATVGDIYRSRKGIDHAVSDCHNALDSIDRLKDNRLLQNQWKVWPGYLQNVLGLSEPPAFCEQVSQHCVYSTQLSHMAMAMIRALCPVTCGCNSLLTGTVFTSTTMGCPQVCLTAVSKTERDTTECVDTDPTSSDPRVQKILGFLEETRIANPNLTSMHGAEDMFMTFGCAIVQEVADMCRPSGGNLLTQLTQVGATPAEFTKIMSMVCPEQCNCNGKRTGYNFRPPEYACPQACICPWTLTPAIADSEWEGNCQVMNPYPKIWPGLPPIPSFNVSIDSQCCHLLQSYMRLTLAMNGSDLSALTNAQRGELNSVDSHLCRSCRSNCQEMMVSIIANGTMTSRENSRTAICWST